jgi:predicted dehydrogenase
MGSEGTLRLTQAGLLPISTDTVSGGRFDDGPEIKQLEIPDRLKEKVDERSPKIEAYHAYQAIVRKFAEGMRNGTSPSPNFEDAYELQRITDAIRESSEAGGWVTV